MSEDEVEQVHQSIYNPDYGIKTNSERISELSLNILASASESLISKGAEVIVLGCTELPLAFTEKYYKKSL